MGVIAFLMNHGPSRPQMPGCAPTPGS